MADIRKSFSFSLLGRRSGRLTLLAVALVVAVGVAICCIILINNKMESGGGDESLIALKDARVVLTDRFDKFKTVVLAPTVAEKLAKRGVDAGKIRQRQVPQNWALSYEKLAADGDFGPRDGHFFVANKEKCVLTGSVVIPESRKHFMKWTLGMPKNASGERSKVEVGIYKDSLYGGGSKTLQTIKLKPGERKTVVVAVDFVDELPNFRPLAKVSGDVNFEEIAVLEGKDDLAAAGMTLVEGTLEECSAIPDPKKSDYPDCRFVCHFTGNSIIKGVPCPQNLSLVVEAFADHKLLGTSRLKAGDKVRCLVMPFEKLPEERKSTQQADDLNLFTMPSYYAVGIQSISDFIEYPQLASPASRIFFTDAKKEYVSVFERHINPPLTEEERRLQAKAIKADLAKINAMLAEYTPEKREALRLSFDNAWEEEKKKDAPGFNRVDNRVWRNIDNSFWALPENYRLNVEESKLSADKMDALLALHDFFEANGCQFIVSLVPNLYEISARVINHDFRQVPDFQTAYVVKQLLENGVEAVYGSDEIVKNFNRYQWAFFFPNDSHPSDTVQDVLSDLVSAKLIRYHFTKTLNHAQFSIIQAPHYYGNRNDHLLPANCDIGGNTSGMPYLCRKVLYDGKEASSVVASIKTSPVCVIGNSFASLPHSLSFASLLSSKVDIPVAAFSRSNYGPMTVLIQDFFSSPEKTLSGKKVAIMHVGTAHILADNGFNNIRQMDAMAQLLTGKSQVGTLAVAKPVAIMETQNNALAVKAYKNLNNATLFQLPLGGKVLVSAGELTNYDSTKETVVIIPSVRTAEQNVRLMINDMPVEIAAGIKYAKLKFVNLACRLPAGVKTLEIQAVGTPGAIFAVRDVQLFQ